MMLEPRSILYDDDNDTSEATWKRKVCLRVAFNVELFKSSPISNILEGGSGLPYGQHLQRAAFPQTPPEGHSVTNFGLFLKDQVLQVLLCVPSIHTRLPSCCLPCIWCLFSMKSSSSAPSRCVASSCPTAAWVCFPNVGCSEPGAVAETIASNSFVGMVARPGICPISSPSRLGSPCFLS